MKRLIYTFIIQFKRIEFSVNDNDIPYRSFSSAIFHLIKRLKFQFTICIVLRGNRKLLLQRNYSYARVYTLGTSPRVI